MRCPNCDFENPDSDERCFRCKAFLGELKADDVMPPRKDKDRVPPFFYEARRRLRAYFYQKKVADIIYPVFNYYFFLPPAASLFLPGLGQLINRKYVKSLFFFLAYMALFFWLFQDYLRTVYLNTTALMVFAAYIGIATLYLYVIHVWIIYDAYVDAVRIQFKRSVNVLESLIVSTLISFLLYFFLSFLRVTIGEGLAPYTFVNIPNFSSINIRNGDTVVLQEEYYRSRPVLHDQIVDCHMNIRFTLGRDYVGRNNPVLMVGLPGDLMTIKDNHICRNGTPVVEVPGEWRNASIKEELRVPADCCWVMPALTGGPFPGFKALLVEKKALRGKYVMILNPPERRRMLP
ncbi:MAG: hypothetical protein AB9903_33805 [Vulcanimicrobiota bacterium]